MGYCRKCKERMPPDFMFTDERCQFCEYNTNRLIGADETVYEKEYVVKDYKALLERLAKSSKLREQYFQ